MPRAVCLSASVLLFAALPVLAQQPAVPASADQPVLPVADYARIETLGASDLSPDGRWVVYDVRRVSGGTELHYRAVGASAEHAVPFAHDGAFTDNSRWLLYTITHDTTRALRMQARRRRGPGGRPSAGSSADSIHDAVGIVDLRSDTTTVLRDVQSFDLSEDGVHVALRRYPSKGAKGHGADLVVRDLERGTDVTFGNVWDYAWSDDGALLAMSIDVDGRTGNGVQVYDVATGTIRSLDASDMVYAGLQWRDHSHDLTAFRSRIDSAFADTGYAVIAWRGVGTPRTTTQVYDFSTDSSAFLAGMRVAPYRVPEWSADGRTLFFGIAPREPKVHEPTGRPAAGDDATPARVEVWHWKALREYHQQDREAQRDRQRTLLVAWSLASNRVVPLTDDYFADVQLADSGQAAVVSDETPYFAEIISGRPYRDVYMVDMATGQRTKALTKVPFAPSVSPTGRYLLYVQDGHWWSYDRTTGARANLTGGIP
ncbi:MAG TPA: hypothetical protein VFJ96_06040, partial [Gemmatimonadaceae bacterium]|nr:hypothetical protein [Gemmatimonadaceae bacterium]